MLDLQTAPARQLAADDERILTRMAARDPDALGELAVRWEGRVHAFVARACGWAACDAVVEDVFWRAWLDAPARAWSHGADTWLRRLVWDACRAHLTARAPGSMSMSRPTAERTAAVPQHA